VEVSALAADLFGALEHQLCERRVTAGDVNSQRVRHVVAASKYQAEKCILER
jgi:hypothetical protein